MLWVGVGAGGYQWTNFVFIINMNIGRPPPTNYIQNK